MTMLRKLLYCPALESHVDKQLCQLLEIESSFYRACRQCPSCNVEAPLSLYSFLFLFPEYGAPLSYILTG